MKRILTLGAALAALLLVLPPAYAQDQINYNSQPDKLVVFFNDIAYARDQISLPGGVDVRLVLPTQVYPDTLVIREDGQRIPVYRLSQSSGAPTVQWTSDSQAELRQVTVDYLLSGVGWSPKYDMWLGADTDRTVGLDFYAEIRNPVLTLKEVAVKLVAGRVDTAQQINAFAAELANQLLAGYADAQSTTGFTGAASIQHIYDIGSLSADPGENIYTRLQTGTFPARRLHLWNAQAGNQVSVIYKVRNVAEVPLAEGIVRSYQNDLFVGSDAIEQTPIGSEGSVTVGTLQNVRADRSETQRALDGPSDRDDLHEIALTLENFGAEAVEIEVVDVYPPSALDFEFSQQPQREGDNVLRWVVTVDSGAKAEIHYSFKN